jgi:hypothetical protein
VKLIFVLPSKTKNPKGPLSIGISFQHVSSSAVLSYPPSPPPVLPEFLSIYEGVAGICKLMTMLDYPIFSLYAFFFRITPSLLLAALNLSPGFIDFRSIARILPKELHEYKHKKTSGIGSL